MRRGNAQPTLADLVGLMWQNQPAEEITPEVEAEIDLAVQEARAEQRWSGAS